MRYRRGRLWFPVLGTALMFLASVGPDDAVSNISKWLDWIATPPAWITPPSVDLWVKYIAIALIVGGLVWFFWPTLARVRLALTGGTVRASGTGSPMLNGEVWVPIHKAVEHVATTLNDEQANDCFPSTLKALRQAAADGKLRIKGRRQLDVPHGSMKFSDVHTEIPSNYWAATVIGPLVIDQQYRNDFHTNPETAFAWGDRGVYEPNRYSDLLVSWPEVLNLWPTRERS